PTCRWTFKTGYKMGAIFSALALSLSTVVLQLLVYVLSVNALPVVILVWIPLWVFLSFRLRRWWMMRKAARRFARLAPSEPLSEATEATETPDAE
ncbi:MAG: hypothetical protein PHV49_06550, partial [Alistipes sp.]|nr:hypothetical protein [Alistipes sp.]